MEEEKFLLVLFRISFIRPQTESFAQGWAFLRLQKEGRGRKKGQGIARNRTENKPVVLLLQ